MINKLPTDIISYIYDYINDRDFYYNISLISLDDTDYKYKRREKIKIINGIKNISFLIKYKYGLEDMNDILYLKNMIFLNGEFEYTEIIKDIIECLTTNYTFMNRFYRFNNSKIKLKKHILSKYRIFPLLNDNLNLSLKDKCIRYLNYLQNTQLSYNNYYVCSVTRLDYTSKKILKNKFRLVYALIY